MTTDDTIDTTAAPRSERTTKIMQLATDAADLFKDFVDRMTEMATELDVPAGEVWDLLEQAFPVDDPHHALAYSVWKELFPAQAMADGEGMIRKIGQLLLEAPKLKDARGKDVLHQAPAMECIVVTSSGHQLAGALSITNIESTRSSAPLLRVGQTNERKLPNGQMQPVLVETFIEPEDIESVSVIRAMEVGSRIVGA